jgi:hypothetical protein
MAINTKAENREGSEQSEIKKFVDIIRPQIEPLGYQITTQASLPYTNFCNKIDGNGKGIDYDRGKKSYAVDILIYRELKNGDKIPLIVIEGKIKGYSTHDIITYSEKAKTHKTVFPHLQYGFIVLNADDDAFMPLRYYMHKQFDFEELFPIKEEKENHDKRVSDFVDRLRQQIDIATEKHKIFFQDKENV